MKQPFNLSSPFSFLSKFVLFSNIHVVQASLPSTQDTVSVGSPGCLDQAGFLSNCIVEHDLEPLGPPWITVSHHAYLLVVFLRNI